MNYITFNHNTSQMPLTINATNIKYQSVQVTAINDVTASSHGINIKCHSSLLSHTQYIKYSALTSQTPRKYHRGISLNAIHVK